MIKHFSILFSSVEWGCSFVCWLLHLLQNVQSVRMDQSQIVITPGGGREGMHRAPIPYQQKVQLSQLQKR